MMRPADLVASATRALQANPLRSALTALGVIIGVSSVVAMVALGSGAQQQVQNSINSLGSNLLIVVPGAAQAGGVRMAVGGGGRDSLTLSDVDAISQIDGVVAVAPSQRGVAQIVANGLNWNTQVQGVTPAYLTARDWTVASGRMFDDTEERQARKEVLLGQTVVDNLFPNMDPVGQNIRISGGTYQVIGVLAAKGQTGFQDQDDIVLAPLTTVKRRISGRNGRADTVSQISVKAASENDLDRIQEDVTTLLRQRHHTAEGDDDFTVQNLASIAQTAQQTTQVFTYLLGGISAVSLLVGGIGIMNIMLVSVTERTKEIGVRKALGATGFAIMSQFLIEALVLCVTGGLVGIGLGVGASVFVSRQYGTATVISPTSILVAFAFSGAVGLAFGLWPAQRAASLNPIEALRYE